MDIPELEELEWLESHAQDDDQFLDDFELDVEPPSPPSSPPSDKPPPRPTLSLPPKPSPFKPHPQINPTSKKRAGSDLLKSISLDVDDNQYLGTNGTNGKRSRNGEDEATNEKFAQSESPDPTGSEIGSGNGSENGGGSEEEEKKEGSDDDEEWLKFTPLQGILEEMEVVEEEGQEKILSRFATEIDGDCVPITGLDGERVYAKICSSVEMDDYQEVRNKKLNFRQDHKGLLQEPVRVLMEKVEHEQFTKALQGSVEGDMTEVVPSSEPVTSEPLWVEKYAPSSFTELLSDEKTNREVLLWLKQWDSSVFGSEVKSTNDDVLTSLRRHSTGSQRLKQSSKSFSRNNRESRFNRDVQKADIELDEENNTSLGIQEMWEQKHKSSAPPEQKVLLLCGSPGLGKTTLAHVAARHCGYRVVEINASDDRSASTIKAKILDAVQMNSVIADSKPKCLVVDEIDGALGDGKGAVEVILQLLSAERKSDTGKENISQEANSGGKSSKKKQKSSVLLRPVICICNDLYVPALRPLRQVAKVHIFVQPTVSRVVNRLKYICNKEGVKTSSIALSALAECTECDIRSCLNTLQFLNKKKEILNVMDISSQVVGRKDATKSAFDIWKEIFQKKKGKSGKRSNNSSSSSTSKDFDFLYSMISNRGDSELILDGIHENIFQLHYVDPLMQKTVQCLDHLGVSDVAHRYIMRTQKMSLLVYQPPIAIFIHRLIAQLERKDIEWPKSLQRHRTILAERMDMFHSWHNGISPYISRHLSTKSFVEDSISPLLHILSPQSLRPVALHLLSDREKSDLSQIVNTMVSYAITYKNVKSDRSDTWRHEDALEATTIALDPPLSNFVQFKDYNSCHIDIALVVKQVLVHEVEKQKIMQGSFSKSTNLHGEENRLFAKNSAGTRLPSKSSHTNGSAEKKTSQKSPAAEKPKISKAVDEVKSVRKTKKHSGGLTSFFNRIRKVGDEVSEVTQDDVPKSATSRRDSHPFLFKFNEGFTNAVKRPVRMREFLL